MAQRFRTLPAQLDEQHPLPIDTPQHAADEIVPVFRSMTSGVVLLLLDRDRVPLVGISIHDAPRNEFEPIVKLLAELRDEHLDSVILGVLSETACIGDEPFVFGESHLDTSDRLAVEAATVHAWAEFSCQLDALGLRLLDVIECTPSHWASVHAPQSPYGDRPQLGDRPTAKRSRYRRASVAS